MTEVLSSFSYHDPSSLPGSYSFVSHTFSITSFFCQILRSMVHFFHIIHFLFNFFHIIPFLFNFPHNSFLFTFFTKFTFCFAQFCSFLRTLSDSNYQRHSAEFSKLDYVITNRAYNEPILSPDWMCIEST